MTGPLKTIRSDDSSTTRRKHQLHGQRQKEDRSAIEKSCGLYSARARARARCLRVESDDDFYQPRSSILCEKRNPRHTTPKRFSLIDFEGPRVVNSTGMHRNATLLNSSAMERLRSLSGPPLLPPTPLIAPARGLYRHYHRARSFSRSIPFSYAVSSGLSHFRSRPRRRGSIFAHRSITTKRGNEGGGSGGSRQYFPSAAYQAPWMAKRGGGIRRG